MGAGAAIRRMWRRWPARRAKLRYMLRAPFFAAAGRGGAIGRDVRITGDLTIRFGDRVALRDRVTLAGNGVLTVGDQTAINQDCILTAMERIEIGADVMLAPRVYILDVDHEFDRRDAPIRAQGYRVAPVAIEDDVWIGAGTVIIKGVRIGRGSVIGANSVVTRDVPPYSIAAGSPARVIRERGR